MLAEAEVVIVGGGPAGLATALELRGTGHDVLVVDRAAPPIDKACGEGLMPDGVEALRRLGVEIDESRRAPFRGIRYIDAEVSAEASFPGQPGMGIRRLVLHRALVDRAVEAGVRTIWGTAVRGLDDRGLLTDQGHLRAKWIVGADGLHSGVRRWAGLESRRARFRRNGVRRHYNLRPWTDLVEVYWADGCEAYVTPVSSEQIGIAFLWSEGRTDFDSLLTRFPELAERLRGAVTASDDRGAAHLEQRTRAVQRGTVALVGDAAGYRDAITGEGMSLAFHQARALADAIAAANLSEYERQNRRVTALPFALIRLLMEAESRPWLRRRLIRTLAAEPALFAKFLAIHTREAPPRSVGPTGILRLARGLLS